MESICLNMRAKENFPGDNFKKIFLYLKIHIFNYNILYYLDFLGNKYLINKIN